MTMIFIDSFDHYATAQLAQKWTTATSNATIVASQGRRSTQAMRTTGSGDGYVAKSVPAAATYIVGFSFKPTAWASSDTHYWISFYEGSTIQVTISISTAGNIIVRRGPYNGTILGTSANALSLNTEHFIEIKVKTNDTTGLAVVKVNGVEWLNLSSVDTNNGGTNTINAIRFGNHTVSANTTGYWDDLYICDTAGTANNDFLGDIRIDCVMPDAEGTYLDGVPSTGTTHYFLVDEIPPTASDYNSLTATGNKDSYGFAAIPSAGTSSIKAAQVVGSMLKSDSGSRGASSVVKSGATTAYGTSAALTTAQLMYSYIHEQDPNTSAAWTESNLNAAEFGFRADA